MASKKAADPASALNELDLLRAIMARAETEALRRNTTGSQVVKIITNDTRFWHDLTLRRRHLEAADDAKVNGASVKTRSISLELRDKLHTGLAKLEREKIRQSRAAA